MQEKQQAQLGFVQCVLPWLVAGGAILLYLATLNHWVSIGSLPFVAKVTGWDWSLPLHSPLYFTLTYPIRWLPAGWQPPAVNVFAAVCSALTLALLARSVALLPHDRTLAQRQRERSEYSLLSIPSAWLPPVFAALVCGLQLTYWEDSTAAANEALDLLLFAYVLRCLLEYRIAQNESWLIRIALVYGVGVSNNWALIGFFPCFLVALVWIKGWGFFEMSFLLRMTGFGAIGLLMYLLLPLVWTMSDISSVGFGQALRAELANQKGLILKYAPLRSRVALLSLTAVLPLFIIGIRWPSSFGDTSAAGAALTNFMFRLIHLVFLAACLSVAFDQRFSPRFLVTNVYGLHFLPFYYLGALSIGYFAGYVLLVFGESRSRSLRRRGEGSRWLDRCMVALMWLTALCVPAALIYKNVRIVRENNGENLRQLAERLAQPLPESGALVLSDDPFSLFLVEGELSRHGALGRHLLIHSRSLPIPEYHHELVKRFPQRWPNIAKDVPPGESVEDVALLALMMDLGRTNRIFYLHPSFGFYFEHFYAEPRGMIYQLMPYPTNVVFPPPFNAAESQTNQAYWTAEAARMQPLLSTNQRGSLDARYAARFYSRALNSWGVALQKERRLPDAERWFELAAELNTNNRPAIVNLDFNKTLQAGTPRIRETLKSIDEKFGLYRNWEPLLQDNGPFDQPDWCLLLGDIFSQQQLRRQAAIYFQRVATLEPTNLVARLALINALQSASPDKALEVIAESRALKASTPIPPEDEVELARMEAAAYFAKTNYSAALNVLTGAREKFPERLSVLDALVTFYGKTKQLANALNTIKDILKLSPDNPQALINQATLYFNHTNYTEAVRSLDRILQRDSKNVGALLYRVFIEAETKQFTNALADVTRLLEIEPDNAEGLLYQGAINIDLKNYDAALAPLDRLIALQPTNWKALQNRAIANLHRGRLNDAEKDYDRLRKQVPRYYIAYYGLGEIGYRRHDVPNATRYYELYLKYAPSADTPELAEERKHVSDRIQELKAGRP